VLCACLGLALAQHHAEQAVVVVAGETTLRTSPLTDAASAFVAHDGAELRVVDRKDDWLQVSDVVHTGWIHKDKTLGLPAT
jgi:SH3-like domain-containing protein